MRIPIHGLPTETIVRVQEAREAQLHEITRLEEESFKDPYPKNLIAELITSNKSCFLVVMKGDNIVGYAVAKVSPPTGHLISICVSRSERRKGVGRLLMMELEKRMLSASVKSMELEVEETNQAAMHLYSSLGYRSIYVEKNYYGLGRNAVIYQKDLTP